MVTVDKQNLMDMCETQSAIIQESGAIYATVASAFAYFTVCGFPSEQLQFCLRLLTSVKNTPVREVNS